MEGYLTLEDAVGVLFSHNEVICLWRELPDKNKSVLWRGMAHQLPDSLKKLKLIRFIGVVALKISESDTINILVEEVPGVSTKLEQIGELDIYAGVDGFGEYKYTDIKDYNFCRSCFYFSDNKYAKRFECWNIDRTEGEDCYEAPTK